MLTDTTQDTLQLRQEQVQNDAEAVVWAPYGTSSIIRPPGEELEAWYQAQQAERRHRDQNRRSQLQKLQQLGITQDTFDSLWHRFVSRQTPHTVWPIARGLPSPVERWSAPKNNHTRHYSSIQPGELLFHWLGEKHWVGTTRTFRRARQWVTTQLVIDVDHHVLPFFWPGITWERLPFRYQCMLEDFQRRGRLPAGLDLPLVVREGFLAPYDGHRSYQMDIVEPYQRIRELIPVEPTAVFRTTDSGGLHMYWLFREPVPLEPLLECAGQMVRTLPFSNIEVFPKQGQPLRVPLGAQSYLLDSNTLHPLRVPWAEQVECLLTGPRYDTIQDVLGTPTPNVLVTTPTYQPTSEQPNIHSRNRGYRNPTSRSTGDWAEKCRRLESEGMSPGDSRYDVTIPMAWWFFHKQDPSSPWDRLEFLVGAELSRWLSEKHNGQSRSVLDAPNRVLLNCQDAARKVVEKARTTGQRPRGSGPILTTGDLHRALESVQREFPVKSSNRWKGFLFLLDFIRFARQFSQERIEIPMKRWLKFKGVSTRRDSKSYYLERQHWLERIEWMVCPSRSYSNSREKGFSIRYECREPEPEGESIENIEQALLELFPIEVLKNLFGTKRVRQWSNVDT